MIFKTTESGLRYAINTTTGSVAYCSLSILSGTRQEVDGQTLEEKYPSGTAHFTEHTIFKGTKHKSAKVLGSYLELLGGELNAYTTKEEIVVHTVTLKEDIFRAAGLIFEMVSEPTFPLEEIEKEKGVVVDEINSYKDSPSDDIYDSFEERIFQGSPLCRPILGTEESLKRITPEVLKAFTQEYFRPDRMVLSIVSPLDEKIVEGKILKIIEKAFLGAPKLQPHITAMPTRPSATGTFNTKESKDNNLVNVVIGALAPSLFADHKFAASMLCNILGGPASNSRLNYSLREKNGWVYGVECNYVQYRDTGIMTISIACEEKNLQKCIKAAHKEIHKLQEKPLSEKVFKAAKKQFLGQLAIASSNNEVKCLNAGKTIMMFGKPSTYETNRAAIEQITAQELQEVACSIFEEGKVSTLIYV